MNADADASILGMGLYYPGSGGSIGDLAGGLSHERSTIRRASAAVARGHQMRRTCYATPGHKEARQPVSHSLLNQPLVETPNSTAAQKGGDLRKPHSHLPWGQASCFNPETALLVPFVVTDRSAEPEQLQEGKLGSALLCCLSKISCPALIPGLLMAGDVQSTKNTA